MDPMGIALTSARLRLFGQRQRSAQASGGDGNKKDYGNPWDTHVHIYCVYITILLYIYIYIQYTHRKDSRSMKWLNGRCLIDVCHFLWLFYDGGSLYYIIQPIYVYFLDGLSLSLPHYITSPWFSPKWWYAKKKHKFLCYTYNMTYILLKSHMFPFYQTKKARFFLQKKHGSFEALPRGCHCDELFRTLTAAQGTSDSDLTNGRCYHQQLAFPVTKMVV